MMATAAAVKERPIIFSAEMVRAILSGRKTQTRRVCKYQPMVASFSDGPMAAARGPKGASQRGVWSDEERDYWVRTFFQYVVPGDLLWVRETWCMYADGEFREAVWYRADLSGHHYRGHGDRKRLKTTPRIDPADLKRYGDVDGCLRGMWHPSIHMPRWASRITLEITGVRVERVQEISEADAIAEGVSALPSAPPMRGHQRAFKSLWNAINAKRGFGWDVNPWCWVIEFKRINGASE